MQVTQERRADILAALTENDVRAMSEGEIASVLLDGLPRFQLELMLHYIAGYAPRGFARAVRRVADPEAVAARVTA